VTIKPLGRTGLPVSALGLGTMPFGQRVDRATAFAIMDRAYEAGVTLFDTADVYPPPSGPGLRGRSEELVGQWLGSRGVRQRIVVATKVGRPMGEAASDRGLDRAHILRACEASLQRLKTDYVDLYQAHRPDPGVPVDETLEAFEELRRAGKVRAVGGANYSARQLAQVLAGADTRGLEPFGSLQLRYHLAARAAEETLLPLCQAAQIGVLAFSPLAGGALTDRAGEPSSVADRHGRRLHRATAALRELLAVRRKSLAEAAVSWVLAQPVITGAIVGASRPEQLAETLRGAASTLDDVERAACDAVWRIASTEDRTRSAVTEMPAGSP
jgi:1-deoxyxylulose-5-phosphate synthase